MIKHTIEYTMERIIIIYIIKATQNKKYNRIYNTMHNKRYNRVHNTV